MKKVITLLVFVFIAFIVSAQNPAFKPGTITMVGSGLNQTMQQLEYPNCPVNCSVNILKKIRWYYIGPNGIVGGFKTAPWFGNGTIDIQLPNHCQGKVVIFYEEVKWSAPQGTQTNWTPKVAKLIN